MRGQLAISRRKPEREGMTQARADETLLLWYTAQSVLRQSYIFDYTLSELTVHSPILSFYIVLVQISQSHAEENGEYKVESIIGEQQIFGIRIALNEGGCELTEKTCSVSGWKGAVNCCSRVAPHRDTVRLPICIALIVGKNVPAASVKSHRQSKFKDNEPIVKAQGLRAQL